MNIEAGILGNVVSVFGTMSVRKTKDRRNSNRIRNADEFASKLYILPRTISHVLRASYASSHRLADELPGSVN